jgi:hypothetical protein
VWEAKYSKFIPKALVTSVNCGDADEEDTDRRAAWLEDPGSFNGARFC